MHFFPLPPAEKKLLLNTTFHQPTKLTLTNVERFDIPFLFILCSTKHNDFVWIYLTKKSIQNKDSFFQTFNIECIILLNAYKQAE